MPQEVELKLAVDPCDIPRVRESPVLREASVKHTGRQRLVSVYYDTPSFSAAEWNCPARTQGRARARAS